MAAVEEAAGRAPSWCRATNLPPKPSCILHSGSHQNKAETLMQQLFYFNLNGLKLQFNFSDFYLLDSPKNYIPVWLFYPLTVSHLNVHKMYFITIQNHINNYVINKQKFLSFQIFRKRGGLNYILCKELTGCLWWLMVISPSGNKPYDICFTPSTNLKQIHKSTH